MFQIETNLNQVLEKFFNRTYVVGFTPKTLGEKVNISDHKVKKVDGLNRVTGKNNDVTYEQLWKYLNNYYDFVKKTHKLGDRNIIAKAMIRLANGKSKEKQLENSVLRTFTTLINSKAFGKHSEEWEEVKGFQFAMKDTGSFYKRLKVWRGE
ncbi:MAG: hypothetical protein LBS34_00315 [Rickettsiales bacterium]|jgi:hypothetical protein|nr:hypothetical protein [Rickettsiales bacterium]